MLLSNPRTQKRLSNDGDGMYMRNTHVRIYTLYSKGSKRTTQKYQNTQRNIQARINVVKLITFFFYLFFNESFFQ